MASSKGRYFVKAEGFDGVLDVQADTAEEAATYIVDLNQDIVLSYVGTVHPLFAGKVKEVPTADNDFDLF